MHVPDICEKLSEQSCLEYSTYAATKVSVDVESPREERGMSEQEGYDCCTLAWVIGEAVLIPLMAFVCAWQHDPDFRQYEQPRRADRRQQLSK